MPQELPIACSLGAGNLERRLATIGEIGAKSLIEQRKEGATYLLRFRSDPETRERLEAIIEAEKQCCAFLDLSLEGSGDNLILSVTAPEAGQATADGFAMAFGAAQSRPTS
jgi:hypothetical protein